MEIEQFERVLTLQIEKSMDTLVVKSKEYATEGDRLANFKVAAALQGVTVRQALAGMMAKHTYSVYEMCGSEKSFTTAQWDEKITDHINYLLLLKAVTVEENAPQYTIKNVKVTEMEKDFNNYPKKQRSGSYAMDIQACIAATTHLTETDDDGYCTYCGWQYVNAPKSDVENDVYTPRDAKDEIHKIVQILQNDDNIDPNLTLTKITNVVFP